MNCPLCVDESLTPHHHGGIEIDVCPRCKGVWLDRGELDRLAGRAPATRPAPPVPADDREPEWRPQPSKKQGKKRKKSFAERLEDVFEEVLDL